MTYFIMLVSVIVTNYTLTSIYSVLLREYIRFGKKINRLISALSIVFGFFVIMVMRDNIFGVYIMVLCAIIFNASKFKVHNTAKWLGMIYIAITYMVISIVTGLCMESLINPNVMMETKLDAVLLLSSLMEFLIVSMVERIYEMEIRIQANRMLIIVSTVLPLLSLYLISIVYDTNITIAKFVLIACIIIVINAGVLLLIFAFVENYDKEIKNRVLIEQNHFYEQQMILMKESYENVRSVKHDLNNSFHVIKDLIEAGEGDQVISFITETIQTIGDCKMLVDTGNAALDGLLNYKIQDAMNRKILCEYKISIPKNIHMNTFDLSTIIGNLLDNAIRETLKSDVPQIFISIEYIKGSVLIMVKNTYVKKEGAVSVVCRDEIDMDIMNIHGVGLTNVRNTIQKYDGELLIKEDDDVFTVKAVCFMEMEEINDGK